MMKARKTTSRLQLIPFFFATTLAVLLLQGCIGDDFVEDQVDPILTITNSLDTIELGTNFHLNTQYLDEVGRKQEVNLEWRSDNEDIIAVSNEGVITANSIGTSTISVKTADTDIITSAAVQITVGNTTVIETKGTSGSIRTTSSYRLEGDFEYYEGEQGVILEIKDNYVASQALPGLYVYLSNNRNTIANAFEIGAVEVFNGAHIYELPEVDFTDYNFIVYFCKPFNVKVGDAEINF